LLALLLLELFLLLELPLFELDELFFEPDLVGILALLPAR